MVSACMKNGLATMEGWRGPRPGRLTASRSGRPQRGGAIKSLIVEKEKTIAEEARNESPRKRRGYWEGPERNSKVARRNCEGGGNNGDRAFELPSRYARGPSWSNCARYRTNAFGAVEGGGCTPGFFRPRRAAVKREGKPSWKLFGREHLTRDRKR